MRRLLQTLRISPCATHRPHFIEPHLSRALGALKNGEFASLDAWVATLPAETYEHLVWRLALPRYPRGWLQAWSDAIPASCHPQLIAAYGDVNDAWAVRGETFVNAIPFLRRRRYPKIMAKAHEKFVRIVEQNPADPMALAGLIHCDVVAGVGEGRRIEWLNQVLATSGFHGPTIRQYARGTLSRWGGEHGEHVRFAGWVVQNAPAGSCALVVAAQAVLDDAFTASEDIYDAGMIRRHLAEDAGADWIRNAIMKWADATPGTLDVRVREIADGQIDSYHAICLESFALAAYFLGADDEARLLLQVLGGSLQSDVWDDFIAPLPVWLYVISSNRRGARRVHDRVCRDLGLDPREICR
ncbi:hypothetical protein ACPEH1_01105 [Stenotrophomonas sp. NPDC077421]|uniref:hypothetical protein n=1 Tax=Stenotrophomonas sp. NPDC077421 TaxID=3414699 RepID=UPI003C304CBE